MSPSSLPCSQSCVARVSFPSGPSPAWHLPLGHRVRDGDFDGASPPVNLPALSDPKMTGLREFLADPAIHKAGHDVKATWVALARSGEGLTLGGVTYDSMIASFVLDPGN